MSTIVRSSCGAAALLASVLSSAPASAQTLDQGWVDASTATAIAASATSVLMPRIFYSSPEATVGWKARWHISALAPTMTHAAIGFLNEAALKEAFADPGPCVGCGFGLFSTETYVASASLGQGVAVFLVDTLSYSGGRFHFGSFAGHVLVPLALTGITLGGRLAAHAESEGQVLGSLGAGILSGALLGVAYAIHQEPECGYTGNLICW